MSSYKKKTSAFVERNNIYNKQMHTDKFNKDSYKVTLIIISWTSKP